MSMEYTHTILCVDDEKNIINSLKRLLRKEKYRILTATSGREGLQILENSDVQLVMCDSRMPEMSGIDFLAKVYEKYPDTIRITLTGYTEVDSITEAINRGAIHKFFLKPWNDDGLKQEVKKALEQYDLIQDNKKLHKKVLEQNEELKCMNDNLEKMVKERTRQLEIRNQALELSREVLDELPLGVVGISREGMVALINKQSAQIRFPDRAIELGQKASECFPDDIATVVDRVMRENVETVIDPYQNNGQDYRIQLLPLTGKFAGKGILLTLERETKNSAEKQTDET